MSNTRKMHLVNTLQYNQYNISIILFQYLCIDYEISSSSQVNHGSAPGCEMSTRVDIS